MKKIIFVTIALLSIWVTASPISLKNSEIVENLNEDGFFDTVKIALFTSPDNKLPDGNYLDQAMIDTLTKWGATVDFIYTTDACFDYERLNNYNLVLICRGCRSGNFTDGAGWSTVKTPVLCLTGYITLNYAMNLISSPKLIGPNGADLLNPDPSIVQYAKIFEPADTAFYNISIMGDSIPYNTWIYDYITYTADSFAANNNGKLLAAYTGLPSDSGNNAVTMARWLPDSLTYDGGVTPQGYRTYMQMGTDNNITPNILNHFQFTEETYQVFKNEMRYLMSLYQPEITYDTSIKCNDATLRQIFLNGSPLTNFWPTGNTFQLQLTIEELLSTTVSAYSIFAGTQITYNDYDSLNNTLKIVTLAEDNTTSREYNLKANVPAELSIYSKTYNKLNVYPNPAFSTLTIITDNFDRKNINVYNSSGSLVMSTISSDKEVLLDIPHLISGMYTIVVKDIQKSYHNYFIKK